MNFINNDLILNQKPRVALSRLNGPLNFTEKGIQSSSFTSNFLKYPLNLSLKNNDDGIGIKVKGQSNFTQLHTAYPFLKFGKRIGLGG